MERSIKVADDPWVQAALGLENIGVNIFLGWSAGLADAIWNCGFYLS
jgi:hypothetical protein